MVIQIGPSTTWPKKKDNKVLYMVGFQLLETYGSCRSGPSVNKQNPTSRQNFFDILAKTPALILELYPVRPLFIHIHVTDVGRAVRRLVYK